MPGCLRAPASRSAYRKCEIAALLITTSIFLASPVSAAADGGDVSGNTTAHADGGTNVEVSERPGDGGTATIATDPTSGPDIAASANGGDTAYGIGGDGGVVDVTINDAVVSVVATANSGGGAGISGDGGTVRVEVNASVSGDISVSAASGLAHGDFAGEQGDTSVTLNEGATVGGLISGNRSTDTLVFALDLPTQGEYELAKASFEAAVASLQANGSSHQNTVSVEGNDYTFIYFDALVEQMTVLGVRPGTVVPVVVSGPGGEQATINFVMPGSPAAALPPAYLRCDTRAVTAFLKNGEITITAKSPDDGAKRFLVGGLGDEPYAFTIGNPIGWTVKVESDGKKTFARVYDADGTLVGSCRL